MIEEGSITIPIDKPDIISREMKTFYNPHMKLNRDISLSVIKDLAHQMKRPVAIGLPLAGTGIRGARILKELDQEIIKHVHFNDYDEEAIAIIKQTLENNNCDAAKYTINQTHAAIFLLRSKGFDYIDIDPFGSPNPFLDAACRRISRDGILAVTATDTSALCGTHPNACRRKYDANNIRTPLMHEFALRILARKVQVIAAQYERAAIPILCYAQRHYVRLFFKMKKGLQAADNILAQHDVVDFNLDSGEWSVGKGNNSTIGPMWTGPLQDKKYIGQLDSHPLIDQIQQESTDIFGFYSLPYYAQKLKISLRTLEYYLEKVEGTRTHLDGQGIRTKKSFAQVMQIMKEGNDTK